MLLRKIRGYLGGFKEYNKERRQVVQSAILEKEARLSGRIVRLVHSIEKGLSI